MKSGFHATIAAANNAVSASNHARANRYTSISVTTPITGATKNTAEGPPISEKSAITDDTPMGNVGTMPLPSGDGVQPSGEASAMRLAADNHCAIGAGSIKRPSAIIRLALT